MIGRPERWAEASIGDVTAPIQIIDPTKSPDSEFRYIDIGAIDNSRQVIEGVKVFLGKDAPSRARRVVQSGDVLFSTVRTYLKNIALVPDSLDGCLTSTGIAVLRPSEAIDGKYLFRWVCADPFVSAMSKAQDGTMYPAVTDKDVYCGSIAVPPLAEQRRIVAKLDRLFERTRRAREELSHIPRLIENYKKAILEAAFRGDLTKDWRKDRQPTETASELIERTPQPQQPRGGREATDTVIPGVAALSVNIPDREPPEGWNWVGLRRVARQETGHTPSRKHPEYWDGNIPWIGIRDAAAHHGGIIDDTAQHPTQLGIDNSSARVLPADTICLSRTASVGYIVRMGRPMATSQDFVTWTCSEALDPDYLLYALLAEGEEIRRFGKGSTHTTIYFPEVRALHICLAPLDEQREIVRRVKAALSWAENIRLETKRAAVLIPNLDQANVAKAFRGELVPQDPEDEPAALLLKRIRSERAGRPARKRERRNKSEAAA